MEKTKKNKLMRIVISIVAALAFWIYMEIQEPVAVTTEVRNIPVEFTGEDTTLADRGLMLLSGYDTTVDLELQGSRSVLWKLNLSLRQLRLQVTRFPEAPSQPVPARLFLFLRFPNLSRGTI